MSENAKPIVSLKELTKVFKSGDESITILNHLDMDFYAGKKFIVTGESGSGKSTMLNLIAGLESPTSGIIEIDGVRTHQLHGGRPASPAKWTCHEIH